MADENKQNENAQVDLSELTKLQFATAWTPSSKPQKSFAPRKDFKPERREGDRREFKKRDFSEKKFDKPRGFRKENDTGKAPRSEGRPFRRPFEKKFDQPKAPFNFTMEVLFYPEDAPFNKLSEIMKSSKRTYQLFDIAEIILEKPERFIVLAKNLPDANGETKPLYCAQPQNLPFEDEASAKAAALEYRLGELFSKEKIETEAPKGNFQVVNKCGITGALLGAPNWHRYNEFIREYHREHCPKASFESFLASIE